MAGSGDLLSVIKSRTFHMKGDQTAVQMEVAVRNALLKMLQRYLVEGTDILEFNVSDDRLAYLIDAIHHDSVQSLYDIRQVDPHTFQARQKTLEI